FATRDVSVGGDDAGIRDEKAGAGTIQTFQIKNSRFSAGDKLFEAKLRARDWRDGGSARRRRDFASEGLRDGIELDVKAIGFEKKIFAVLAAVERNPLHRPFGEGNFFCGVAGKIEPRD